MALQMSLFQLLLAVRKATVYRKLAAGGFLDLDFLIRGHTLWSEVVQQVWAA
jgi:hypothetical protein